MNGRLEPGMLVLGGAKGMPGEPLDHVWTVLGPRSLFCHRGSLTAKVTLKGYDLPEGWYVVGNREAADVLADHDSLVSA